MSGKYIYGIINSGDTISRSDNEYGIYTIPYGDISAVVSDSEVTNFTHLPGNVAARHLVRHQVIIEQVMKDFAIVPMRMGTCLLNEGEVKQVLAKGEQIIREILKKIKNKVEFNVTALWNDLNAVIREVAEEEEIKTLTQGLVNKKNGVTTDEQMKVGFLIKSYVSKRKMEYASRIVEALKTVSHEQKRYDCTDDNMIVNLACFINEDMQPDFEAKLEELNNSLNEKVRFKCVGPLPSYSFYLLEAKRMKYEDVNLARKTLGLSDFATKDDIKKAYRNYAFMHHPDRQADTKKAEMDYSEIAKAYKLLCEYCNNGACSFGEEQFAQNAIAVGIRE